MLPDNTTISPTTQAALDAVVPRMWDASEDIERCTQNAKKFDCY